jgi:arylsulfatase A-like enzyme
LVLSFALSLALSLTTGCAKRPPSERRPNIVLLSIDTLRRDFVGAYGAERGGTPNLDRLARRGRLCVDAVSTSSWTLPAHMSLLTGLYPAGHGVRGDGQALSPEQVTLPERLRDLGYRTAGFVSGPYLHRGYGFDQGFDLYRHCMAYAIETLDDGRVSNVIRANLHSQSGRTSPQLLRESTEWLASRDDDEPWFLFVHWWDPHYDFEPPAPWDAWLGEPDGVRMTGRGFLQNPRVRPEMTGAERQRLLDLYRGEIASTDAAIGRLLQFLEESGEADRTIVVLTADHGEEFFEHGHKGHRNNLYAETLRVPLVIAGPGVGAGLRKSVRSLVDVVPTLAELVGLEPGDLPGRSILTAGSALQRTGTLADLHGRLAAWRGERWKLILDRESGKAELYDRLVDPSDRIDRAADEPGRVEELRARLEDATQAAAPAAEADIDEATAERLRALGYTD